MPSGPPGGLGSFNPDGGKIPMTPQMTTSTVLSERPGRPWMQRVWRSNGFAWILSAGLHGVLFLGLYMAVLHDEPAPRRIIIPEARLAAVPGSPETARPFDQKPLQLSPRPENPVAAQKAARVDEEVVSAVVMDEVPSLALPAERPAEGVHSLTAQVAAGGAPQAP